MKRVAIILPGGTEVFDYSLSIPALSGLIRRLSALFDITVYTFIKTTGLTPIYQIGNARIKTINASYNAHLFKKTPALINQFRSDFRKNRYDLVHALWAVPCGFMGIILGKLFNVPVLVSLQGGETVSIPHISYGNMRKQPLKFLTLWTIRNADSLTVLTQYQLDTLRTFIKNKNNIDIIPYGVDTGIFAHSDSKPLAGHINFIHVATINPVKDQETLLNAFALIRKEIDCRLIFIGYDTLNGKLQKFADQMGIAGNVDFLGYVPYEDLPFYYGRSRILLHTSLYEAQGVVIAEAFASGNVVCGTKTGLLSDLEPECTITVDTGDYESLAEKILKLVTDRHRYAQLREKGLQWAQKHDADWTAEQFGRKYMEMIDTPE